MNDARGDAARAACSDVGAHARYHTRHQSALPPPPPLPPLRALRSAAPNKRTTTFVNQQNCEFLQRTVLG